MILASYEQLFAKHIFTIVACGELLLPSAYFVVKKAMNTQIGNKIVKMVNLESFKRNVDCYNKS